MASADENDLQLMPKRGATVEPLGLSHGHAVWALAQSSVPTLPANSFAVIDPVVQSEFVLSSEVAKASSEWDTFHGGMVLRARRTLMTLEPVPSQVFRVQVIFRFLGHQTGNDLISIDTRVGGKLGGEYLTPQGPGNSFHLFEPHSKFCTAFDQAVNIGSYGERSVLVTIDDDGTHCATSIADVQVVGDEGSETDWVGRSGQLFVNSPVGKPVTPDGLFGDEDEIGVAGAVSTIAKLPGGQPGMRIAISNREYAHCRVGVVAAQVLIPTSAVMRGGGGGEHTLPCDNWLINPERTSATQPSPDKGAGQWPSPVEGLVGMSNDSDAVIHSFALPPQWSRFAGVGALVNAPFDRRKRIIQWKTALWANI